MFISFQCQSNVYNNYHHHQTQCIYLSLTLEDSTDLNYFWSFIAVQLLWNIINMCCVTMGILGTFHFYQVPIYLFIYA